MGKLRKFILNLVMQFSGRSSRMEEFHGYFFLQEINTRDQWTLILFLAIKWRDISDPHLDFLIKFRHPVNDVVDISCQHFYDMKIAKNCREFAITNRTI